MIFCLKFLQNWAILNIKKNMGKKCFFQENFKDDQNGLIHPENSRLKFFIIGGVKSNFRADSPI